MRIQFVNLHGQEAERVRECLQRWHKKLNPTIRDLVRGIEAIKKEQILLICTLNANGGSFVLEAPILSFEGDALFKALTKKLHEELGRVLNIPGKVTAAKINSLHFS